MSKVDSDAFNALDINEKINFLVTRDTEQQRVNTRLQNGINRMQVTLDEHTARLTALTEEVGPLAAAIDVYDIAFFGLGPDLPQKTSDQVVKRLREVGQYCQLH